MTMRKPAVDDFQKIKNNSNFTTDDLFVKSLRECIVTNVCVFFKTNNLNQCVT